MQVKAKVLPGKLLLLLTVILILGGLLFSGCGMTPTPIGWSGVAVTNDALFVVSIEGKLVGLNKSDGEKLWEPTLLSESAPKVAVYGTPVLYEGSLYVGGYKADGDKGSVYAISADSGTSHVVYPRGVGLEEPIVGGVVVSQGIVYFGGGDKIDGKTVYAIYAVDTLTGLEHWPKFDKLEDKTWSTPVIDGETIYVSSFDKRIYALDINNGGEKWRFKEAKGAFATTPLLYQGALYIGSFDRHVYAVNAIDGSLKWRSEVTADKWFWAKPVAYNGVIYAPSVDGRVYLLDAESGREVASSIDLGSPISSSPVVVGDRVIIASQEGRVFSLDTSSNRVGPSIFTVNDDDEVIRAPLSASDGVVYIHAQTSKHDRLYAIDPETGVEVWGSRPLS